jgi:hypothetical protein
MNRKYAALILSLLALLVVLIVTPDELTITANFAQQVTPSPESTSTPSGLVVYHAVLNGTLIRDIQRQYLPYGQHTATLQIPGYIRQEITFILNQPQRTITVTLQPDLRWMQLTKPANVNLRQFRLVEPGNEAELVLRNTNLESSLVIGQYILRPVSVGTSLPSEHVMRQFAPNEDFLKYEYYLDAPGFNNYGLLLISDYNTLKAGYNKLWLIDLATLNTPHINRLDITGINGFNAFWARKRLAFLEFTIFVEGRYGSPPAKLALVTFDKALTRFVSEDLLMYLKTLFPLGRSFVPIAATDDLEMVLVQIHPDPSGNGFYDYAVLDTRTKQASALDIEQVITAVWLGKDVLLMYSHLNVEQDRNAIIEYNTRTNTQRTITTLQEINAYGLEDALLSPDGSFLVGIWRDKLLIFDMAHVSK